MHCKYSENVFNHCDDKNQKMCVPLKQEEQSSACGPKQVLHDASHVWHSPYFPGIKTAKKAQFL